MTERDVQRLAQLDAGRDRILSVYLDLAPDRQPERSYRIALKDMVRDVESRLNDEADRDQLKADAARMEAWLDAAGPGGRSVAVFSSILADVWDARFLRVPVPDRVVYEPWPDVAPLVDLLDEFERSLVVLVDKERAKAYLVFEGRIEELPLNPIEERVYHPHSAPAARRDQPHHDAHLHDHAKHTVDELVTLAGEQHFDRLLLGGTEEAVAEVRSLLPPALTQRLVGTLPALVTAGPAEVLRQTLEVEREIERAAERDLVGTVRETAGGGGPASCGPQATLLALFLREVMTLVIEDFRQPGGICASGELLVEPDATACPEGGPPPERVENVVPRAIAQALEQSARVEIVHGDAAQALRATCQGMAALLRFKAI